MIAKNYYVFKNGRLARRSDSLCLKPILANNDNDEVSDFKIPISIPVENVEDIYMFGENLLNSKLFSFLSQKNICLHFFNYYNHYTGSFIPKEFIPSGCIQLRQAEHILSLEKRLAIAREFVDSALFHCIRNLRYRDNRGSELRQEIEAINALCEKIPNSTTIESLMGIEGNAHRIYYSGLGKVIDAFSFTKRTRRPPQDPVNATMSFLNSLAYTSCLAQIYRTHLTPTMSFLHTPGTQRFSLCLDIAEIFKPLIADRILIRLFNRKQLQKKDFHHQGKACYLTTKGSQKVLKSWEEELQKTIKHRKLKRKVSYRTLIRMECYKIEKHLLGMETYKSLKAWW